MIRINCLDSLHYFKRNNLGSKIPVYHSVCLVIRSSLLVINRTLTIDPVGCGQAVHLGAGLFTLTAANATGQVHQTPIE